MVMKKKAQAAMEFLMTYGWAILVVLVVIGALAYFGVLNPQNLLPEKCTLPVGLYCKDYLISSTDSTVTLKIENGIGHGIIIRTISITGQVFNECSEPLTTTCGTQTTGDGQCDYNTIPGWRLGNGQSGTVKIRCASIPEFSGKTKGDITLTHCDDSSSVAGCIDFTHTGEGDLMARVES